MMMIEINKKYDDDDDMLYDDNQEFTQCAWEEEDEGCEFAVEPKHIIVHPYLRQIIMIMMMMTTKVTMMMMIIIMNLEHWFPRTLVPWKISSLIPRTLVP